ncbi:MAG TPA: outer membrane beta-barrel protein [Caulobacteraceae bacterium]|nr:outer membrane beta-barrel protein [Caulobacteraceae bacterium]
MTTKILVVSLLLSGVAVSAHAAGGADGWTGPYVGVDVGGAQTSSGGQEFCIDPSGAVQGPTCQVLPSGASGAVSASGAYAGLHAGYNAALGSAWVAGGEVDLGGGSISGTRTTNGPFPFAAFPGFATPAGVDRADLKIDGLDMIRGRLGYALSDRWLAYATGGVAFAHVKASTTFTAPNVSVNYVGASSGLQTGWTAGGGLEAKLRGPWSGRIEVLYFDAGSQTVIGRPDNPGVPPIGVYQHNQTFDARGYMVTVGASYRFTR